MPLSADRIYAIFQNLSSPETASKYWDHVAEDVHWTIIGSTSMSGVYTTRQAFIDATIKLLGTSVLTEPLRIQPAVVTAAAVEDEPGKTRAAVEMKAIDATCRNGMVYNMQYCWICTIDDATEQIQQVRAYLDTDLLTRAIEGNRAGGRDQQT